VWSSPSPRYVSNALAIPTIASSHHVEVSESSAAAESEPAVVVLVAVVPEFSEASAAAESEPAVVVLVAVVPGVVVLVVTLSQHSSFVQDAPLQQLGDAELLPSVHSGPGHVKLLHAPPSWQQWAALQFAFDQTRPDSLPFAYIYMLSQKSGTFWRPSCTASASTRSRPPNADINWDSMTRARPAGEREHWTKADEDCALLASLSLSFSRESQA